MTAGSIAHTLVASRIALAQRHGNVPFSLSATQKFHWPARCCCHADQRGNLSRNRIHLGPRHRQRAPHMLSSSDGDQALARHRCHVVHLECTRGGNPSCGQGASSGAHPCIFGQHAYQSLLHRAAIYRKFGTQRQFDIRNALRIEASHLRPQQARSRRGQDRSTQVGVAFDSRRRKIPAVDVVTPVLNVDRSIYY